jgi:hypothetical protein
MSVANPCKLSTVISSGGKSAKLTAKTHSAATATIHRVANERATNSIAPIIAELQAGGAISLQDIAAGLNQRGITTARGGTWSEKQVARILARRRGTK